MSRIIGLTFPAAAGAAATESYACPHCGKPYKTQQSLDKHIRDKHSEASEEEVEEETED